MLYDSAALAEPPDEIYGKVMSIRDDLIAQYFELVTDVSDKELEEIRQQLGDGTVNPMDLKKRLAREIVAQLHTQKAAEEAESHFVSEFQKKKEPEEMPERQLSYESVRHNNGEIDVRSVLMATGLVGSRSEASRLVKQGAVDINGRKMTRNTIPVADFTSGEATTIHVGRLRWCKIKMVLPKVPGT